MHPVFKKLTTPILDIYSSNNVSSTIVTIQETPTVFTPRLENTELTQFQQNLERDRKSSIVEIKQITESDFWKIIDTLNWTDKSDRIIIAKNKVDYLTNMLGTQLVDFKMHFTKYYNKLEHIFITRSGFTLNAADTKKLVSHIICRGKQFYDAIVDDSYFADYLIDCQEYQGLFEHD